MIAQTNTRERIGTIGKAKALAVGLLVMGMIAAGLTSAGKADASTTFTVNLPGDTRDADLGDGSCDVNLFGSGQQCTLRAAIEQTNATAGADDIRFDIPDTFGAGVKTINVGATGNGALPPITQAVTIDGYTQPGASPNTLAVGDNAALRIELNGAGAGSVSGLVVDGGRFSVIKGLVINRFAQNGIEVSAPDVTVSGNFIGTDPSGTSDRGNGSDGVLIDKGFSSLAPFSDIIGGFSTAERNIISGNGGYGINIQSSSKGPDPTTGSNNEVRNNYIGTDKNGTAPLGNAGDGVLISGATNNDVGGGTNVANTIAFNGGNGVFVNTAFQGPATGNRVISNSVFSNGGLGIDLISNTDGATPNDTGDADVGPNGLQNFPVLTSVKNATTTTITGKLGSAANTSYIVQFFSNPSGGNEGKKLVGQRVVTTDASGNVSFTFKTASKVAKGRSVTATATDPAGNTSEFSAPRTVTSS